MILGERINGTDSKKDYLLCAQSKNFFLSVKPIIHFQPQNATFVFGLRFRAVSDLEVTDPNCHGIIWSDLPFKVLKPTHASVTCLTHALHAKELSGKGNATTLMALLERKKLFVALGSMVIAHLGNPEDLQHLEGEAISQGLREILGEKLASVEKSMNVETHPPIKGVDGEIADKVEAFLDLVDDGGKDPFSGGTVH